MKSRWLVVALALLLMTTAAPVAQAQKTLVVCMAETGTQEGLDYYTDVLIPAFEAKYPDVKVDFQICGWGVDTIVARYIGGTPPDVFQIGGDNLGSYLDMIAPIDDLVEGWEDLSDFPALLMDGLKVNGQLYGIPFSMTTRSLTYRTDLFEASGLDSNSPPRTWDELVEYGRRLTRRDADGKFTMQGFGASNHWLKFAAFLFQAGTNYMSEDLSRFTFADEAGMEAASFVRDMFWEWEIADPARSLGDEVHTGGAAMSYQSVGIVTLPDYSPIVEVAPPTTKVRPAQIIEPNIWVVINTTALRQEAWNWIAFVSEIENLVEYSRLARTLPPRLSAVNYSPWADDRRIQQHYANTVVSMTPSQQHPLMNATRRDFVQPYLERIFYHGEPLTVWEEAQRLANARLDEWQQQRSAN